MITEKPKRKQKPLTPRQRLARHAAFLLLTGIVGFLVGLWFVEGRHVTIRTSTLENRPTSARTMPLPPAPVMPQERGDEASVRLDVAFVLDTTGSMGDELAQLQNNILAIASHIDQLPQSVHVRYGLVAYRDRADAYTVKLSPFTTDVSIFQSQLMALSANGGGDTPEALNEALDNAIHGLSWRDENTIKLVFVVTDAAPKYYADDVLYTESARLALAYGIKIHTLASSGLDPSGEYVLRQLSQMTLGRFIFLTYDKTPQSTAPSSGEYRDDLSVGQPQEDYTVEQLDKLVLRLIRDELAHQLD